MQIQRIDRIDCDTGQTHRDGSPRPERFVRLTTDTGIQGSACWLWPDNDTPEDWRRAEDLLIGKDPSQTETIWQDLWDADVRGITQSMIDVALWDILGRAAGKPVHALLGTKRHRIKAYVSSPFNVGGGKPAAYAEEALRIRDEGFHGYKIHPTHGEEWGRGKAACDLETDLAIARAVGEAIGDDPDFALMWDNYHTYSYAEAIRVGRELERLGFLWYESPIWEEDEDMCDYVRLCEELEITVCAPEVNDGAHMSRLRWMEAGACDMNRIDFQYGGFTSCLAVTRACEAAGMSLDLHTGYCMHLQVFAATTDETIPYIEHYATSSSVQFEDGYALVPQTPGMGLELDWGKLEACRIR
jgi:L-alanine-DL-glutamate epimerase-like enolase superfamily enzyme